MIEPPIEEVIGKAGGRFNLVLLASRRARQINSYYTQLGGGIGRYVPPQVHSLSHKPLTIALEEISADKLRVGTGETTESQAPDTLDVLLSYQTEPLDEGDPVAGIETLGSPEGGDAPTDEPVGAEASSEAEASDDSVEGTAVENPEDR